MLEIYGCFTTDDNLMPCQLQPPATTNLKRKTKYYNLDFDEKGKKFVIFGWIFKQAFPGKVRSKVKFSNLYFYHNDTRS